MIPNPYNRRINQFWGQTNQDWRFPAGQGYHAGLPAFRAIEQQNWNIWPQHETIPFTLRAKVLIPDAIGSWRNGTFPTQGTPVPLTSYLRGIRTPYPVAPKQAAGVARSRYGGLIVYGTGKQ